MGPIVAAIQVITAITQTGIVSALIARTVMTIATQMIFKALTPKPKGGAGGDFAASGVEQQRQIGEATPRAIALGWTIVAGQECALWASGDGDDNRFNTRVIVISDWPTTLQKVWVRGRELTFEGDINAGWFACNQYRSKTGAARLWMRFVRGDWNQAADPLLISYANANASWTSEDRLRGVSALLIRREYDVDAFQSGAPDNDDLRVEVRNAPVYDWRDATQNINDVTTWKPSENPIVLVENALSLLRAPAQFSPGSTDPIVGPGLDFSRRPMAKLTAMANICDELVSGQPRYRAGGVVSAAMTGREIIDRFAAACAGSWVSSGDGGYLRPGHVPAPVMDIPAGALKANASDRYDPWARPDSVVNSVIASYPDPAQAWQVTPLPPATDAAWVAADGGVRTGQEDLSFCPYRDQAWRIAVRRARGVRLMGARDFTGPHWLIELEPGDVVTAPDPALPYLSTRWWMVQRTVLLAKSDGLTVQLTLNEIDSAIDAAPPALGAAATFIPSSLSRALAVPPVTIGQRVVSGGSGGQYPELTFLVPDTASQASGVVQLQGPATANDNALLAAAQIRNIALTRGLLHGEPVVPGWYRWRAAGRDVDGSVGAFDASWQAAVQVVAPLTSGAVAPGAVRVGTDIFPGSGSTPLPGTAILNEANGIGVNQVINSDLNQGTTGFFHTAETDITGPARVINAGRNLAAGPGYFGARNVFWTEVGTSTGSLSGNFIRGWAQRGFFTGLLECQRWASRCRPGDRVFISANVSVHGMTHARLIVRFFDNLGNIVSDDNFYNVLQSVGDGRSNGKNGQQGIPDNFTRVGAFFIAPANAAYSAMAVEGRNLNGLQTYVYIFSCDYQNCVVPPGQTAWPPYVPGQADMGADRTGENTAQAIVGQGWGATANEDGASNARIQIAQNQVVNSDYNQGTNGFFFLNSTNLTGSGFTTGWGRNLSGWFGVRNVLWGTAQVSSGTLSPLSGGYLYGWGDNGFFGGLSNLNRFSLRVKPGDRIYVAHSIAAHRASRAGFEVRWFDKDGVYLSSSNREIPVVDADDGGPSFGGGVPANLVDAFLTAPANAAFASSAPYILNIRSGVTSVFIFHADPFMVVLPAGHTGAPVYNVGPPDRAADRTGENTAVGFQGQGNNATRNTNSGNLADRPVGANGDQYFATDTKEAFYKIGGTWTKVADVANSFNVSLSATNLTATGTGTTLTTDSVTATVSGGSGSYSYAWAVLTKSNQGLNPFMTSQSATSACRVTLGAGQSVEGTIQLIVTDTATGAFVIKTLTYNITNTA